MHAIRALLRTVIVGLAIWAFQTLLRPVNVVGIWAMVSLGIASAIVGYLLTDIVTHARTRALTAMWHFVGTLVVLEGYYALLPKHVSMVMGDILLALVVAILSGFLELLWSPFYASR